MNLIGLIGTGVIGVILLIVIIAAAIILIWVAVGKKQHNKTVPNDANNAAGGQYDAGSLPSSDKPASLKAAIPVYLRKTDDPIAKMMLDKDMITVTDEECKYQTEIYGAVANSVPETNNSGPGNTVKVYCKSAEQSWYEVHTIVMPSVRTTPTDNGVLTTTRLCEMLGTHLPFIQCPSDLKVNEFSIEKVTKLPNSDAYNKQRGLDESSVFCVAFKLNGALMKSYTLVARKEDHSWRLQCIMPSHGNSLEPLPMEIVPPGYMFESFKPLV